MPRLTYLPGLVVFVVEGLVWALSAATGWGGWIAFGGLTLMLSAVAAIVAVPIIIEGGGDNRWWWAVASFCISALGGFFGFIFWLEALSVGCGGGCFGD